MVMATVFNFGKRSDLDRQIHFRRSARSLRKNGSPGDVELTKIVQRRRGQQFCPVREGQIGDLLRYLPDIAHFTATDAVVGDFKTYGFERTGPATVLQQAIATTIVNEFSDNRYSVHRPFREKRDELSSDTGQIEPVAHKTLQPETAPEDPAAVRQLLEEIVEIKSRQ